MSPTSYQTAPPRELIIAIVVYTVKLRKHLMSLRNSTSTNNSVVPRLETTADKIVTNNSVVLPFETTIRNNRCQKFRAATHGAMVSHCKRDSLALQNAGRLSSPAHSLQSSVVDRHELRAERTRRAPLRLVDFFDVIS